MGFYVSGFVFFFNLHFLNYSKSCQVHICNRKLTNRAVVLKTRNTDGIKTSLETFSRRERGSRLDHPLPAPPVPLAVSVWVAGAMPFEGRKPDKPLTRTRDLATQAVFW